MTGAATEKAANGPKPEAAEAGPRRTLAWGGAALTLGLAIVGVGSPAEGGPVALAGLLIVIYGIHRFGRLGPDDIDPGEAYATSLASDAIVAGAAALLAGTAFVVGAAGTWPAYLVMGAGAIALGWGQREKGRLAPKRAVSTSPGPSAGEAKATKPRRRARRTREADDA